MAQRVSHWLLVGAVGGALALAGCHKQQNPAGLLAEAKAYQQKGDHKAAQIQLKNMLEQEPRNGEARLLLARVSFDAGHLEAAEKEARSALALNYQPSASLAMLCQALMMQGKFQQVLDETDKFKDQPAMQTLRGDALLGLSKLDEAKRVFEAVLQVQPDNADALTGLARHAALSQDLATASRLTDAALQHDSGNALALGLKAELARVQGRPGEALAGYNELLKLHPGNRNAHVEKAMLEMAAGKLDVAEAELAKARDSGPKDVVLLYAQALLDFTRGKYPAARDSLTAVLKSAPGHMPSQLLAGATHFQLGSLEQAEVHLRSYIDARPDDRYGRKLLAATRLRAKDAAGAMAALGPALGDKDVDAVTLALAGDAEMQRRDYGKAAGYLDKAVALDKDNARLHTALGLARLGMKEQASGMAELERAVALDPESLYAAAMLARARIDRGEPAKALDVLKQLDARHGKQPDLHILRAMAYLGLHQPREARQQFEQALQADPRNFGAATSLAQLDMLEKQPQAARQRLEALWQQDKQNTELMYALSVVADMQGQRDVARDWLQKAVAAQPNALAPALRLGAFQVRNGDAAQAVTLLRKHQATSKDNAQLLDLLAAAEQLSGQPQAALETLNRLSVLVPRAGLPYVRSGKLYLQLNQLGPAQRVLEKAVSLEPSFTPGHVALAEVAVRKGDYAAALASARKVQQLLPKQADGYMLEGDVLMYQQRAVEALAAYGKAAAFGNNSLLQVKQATALRAAGRASEADSKMAEWRRAAPQDPVLQMYAAEQQLAQRRYPEAIKEFEAITQAAPDNALALNNLAFAYQQVKDKRALATAESAYKLAGDNPDVIDTLAWLLVEQGKQERALPLLRQAAEMAPRSGDIHYHLAYSLHRSGDLAQARKELKLALATGNNFTHAADARTLLKQLE